MATLFPQWDFLESYGDLVILKQGPGPRFNIKMLSYQYRKSHCGDKTILRPSYLHNGISYTGKMISLYWIRPLGPLSMVWISIYIPQYFHVLDTCYRYWSPGLFMLICQTGMGLSVQITWTTDACQIVSQEQEMLGQRVMWFFYQRICIRHKILFLLYDVKCMPYKWLFKLTTRKTSNNIYYLPFMQGSSNQVFLCTALVMWDELTWNFTSKMNRRECSIF